MRFVVAVAVLSAVLFSSPAKAQEWKPPQLYEVAEMAAAQSLVLIDVLQTLDMKRHPDKALFDANPLLGDRPSDARIIGMAALGAVVTTTIWYALPTRCRWTVPLFLSIGEAVSIAGNVQAGMVVRF